MLTSNRVILLILVAAVLGPSACSLSRNAPPQQYYILGDGFRPETGVLPREPGGTVVGLRPTRLADYLDTPFIVVRRASHRVGFSEFHRWGEDLAGGIDAAVAGHLAARAPAWHIKTAPWEPEAQPDYVVQLHLLSFEGMVLGDTDPSAGEAHLRATWEIFRRHDGALLARGGTELREPGWTVDDFDGLVNRLDQGLATLAQALLVDLQRVVLGGE